MISNLFVSLIFLAHSSTFCKPNMHELAQTNFSLINIAITIKGPGQLRCLNRCTLLYSAKITLSCVEK
jgi:hypothetical protein